MNAYNNRSISFESDNADAIETMDAMLFYEGENRLVVFPVTDIYCRF